MTGQNEAELLLLVFLKEVEALESAEKVLRYSYEKCAVFIENNQYNNEQLESLESMTSRFARLCDILINKKTYVYFPNIIDSIKYTIKNMYKNDNLNFNKLFDNNDGIIFQPYESPYYNIAQIKDKSKYLPILKWKFPEKVSIDFKIRKNIDNKYKLLSFIYQSNKEVDVEFTDEE
jgi:hypothetical protein